MGDDMAQTYGMEVTRGPSAAQGAMHSPPAVKYLVLIDSAGHGRAARLYLPTLEQVAEFDAAAPEVLSMTDGLMPAHDAALPQWDLPLRGHSAGERAGAEVYTLDV